MVALHAAVELRRRLVPAPGLQEPPLRFVVAALWAFDLGNRQRAELVLLVPDHYYRRRSGKFLLGRLCDAPDGLVAVSAVVTVVCYLFFAALDLLEFEPGAALWAELNQPDPPPRTFCTLT